MKHALKGSQAGIVIHRVAVAFSVLAICLSPLTASARQNSSSEPRAAQQADDQSSREGASGEGAPQGSLSQPLNSGVPPALTLPAGTAISVRVTQWLSSDQNHPGDSFSAELDQPLVVNGWVVARRGQSVIGRVVVAEKAAHGRNESRLGVELAELILADGQQLPVRTELVRSSTARSQGRDAATVGTTAAIGAIIGAVAGGGQGAAIGAAAGLGAGIAVVLSTPGRPTVIHPEDLLTFRLDEPLAISTEQSQAAFRPVTQGDYNRDADAYANYPPRRHAGDRRAYPPPPYYYGGYCYPGAWGCYPAPLYFGFYGAYGFGSRGVFLGRRGFRR